MKRIFPLAAMLVLGGTVKLVALDVKALDGIPVSPFLLPLKLVRRLVRP